MTRHFLLASATCLVLTLGCQNKNETAETASNNPEPSYEPIEREPSYEPLDTAATDRSRSRSDRFATTDDNWGTPTDNDDNWQTRTSRTTDGDTARTASDEELTPRLGDTTAGRTHVVRKGDTLYALARKYYNDQSRWKDIWEANRRKLPDPGKLRIGMQLQIP